MSGAVPDRAQSPFSKGGILAIVLVGFGAFVAMLYFLGSGNAGGERGGDGHVASNALNGYSALAALLEANDFEVEQSRGRDGLETSDLLVLTPPRNADPEEIGAILEDRQYYGPTLVILPKWFATRPTGEIAEEDRDKVRRDWVRLMGASAPFWTGTLPEPFALEVSAETAKSGEPHGWAGMGLSGKLPTGFWLEAKGEPAHEALVIVPDGGVLALNVTGEAGSDYNENAHWTLFVVEPDLVNNYGLADPARAALALALVEEAGYGERRVAFDMYLTGIGGTINLLTLAFQPPFLAATLCLILAILIVGWRAFLRFGPVAAPARTEAFGKAQLVRNGAGLIVRAGRLRLLAAPYIALTERRLGRALGLARPGEGEIDHALKARLPDEEPFSHRAGTLRNAVRSSEVLRAAQHLDQLAQKTMGTKRQ
jgi:hypothetical protein